MKSLLKLSFLFAGIVFTASASHSLELTSIGSKCKLHMKITQQNNHGYSVEYRIWGSGKGHVIDNGGEVSGMPAVIAAEDALNTIGDYYVWCSASKAEVAKQVDAIGNLFKDQLSCEDISFYLSSSKESSSMHPEVVDVAETLKRFASCNSDL